MSFCSMQETVELYIDKCTPQLNETQQARKLFFLKYFTFLL